MVTEQEVLDALARVEDPEVHKSIVELDMVRKVEVRGTHVNVEVALTIGGCPLRTKIEKDVEEVLTAIPGVESVNVKIGTMTDAERARFTAKIRGGADSDPSVPPLLRPDSGTQFIAIASGKGGVGKSTVTANLAVTMAEQGFRVGVLDADIYGFSIPHIFGVGQQRPALVDQTIMPVQSHGVKLISMHFFVPDNNPVIWRGPMLGKMIRNFFHEVHWGDLDVLFLDLPPGTGDVALDVHQLLPAAREIVVTTPQWSAAEVAVRAGAMALKTNHPVMGVIENMAYLECPHCGEKSYLFGQGGGKRVAEALGVALLGQVPIAADNGSSATGIFGEGTPQKAVFKEISKTLAGMIGARMFHRA